MDFSKVKQFFGDKVDAVKDNFNQYKQDNDVLSTPIEDKDENTYLGIGENRHMPSKYWASVADQKRTQQMMDAAGSSVGSISKVGGNSLAMSAAKKLEDAIARGHKPTAAESMALSKFKNEIPVIPSHEEANAIKSALANEEKERQTFLRLKGLLGK